MSWFNRMLSRNGTDAGVASVISEPPTMETLDMFQNTKTREPDIKGNTELFTADGSAKRRAAAWLDAQLRRASKERFFVPDHMTTPELAELILTKNIGNRRIRNGLVTKIANAIKDGRYLETPHPVCINNEGLADDGQHRLNGIVLAGKAAPLTYAFGWPHEIFKVLDNGAPRSGADVLQIDGEEWFTVLAAALRKLNNVTSNAPRGNAGIENDKLVEFLAANPMIRNSCPIGSVMYREFRVSPTAFVVAHYLINRKGNTANSSLFFEKLAKSVDLGFVGLKRVKMTSDRDPVRVLQKYLKRDEFRGGHGGVATLIAAAIIKAFNLHKAGLGATTSKIEWKLTEPFPEVE